MSSLKKQALHGAFWSFAERFGMQAGQFILSIVLARMLLPADFGLIGMLSIFMILAQVLIDSGFGQALIQKDHVDDLDICSVFYLNILIGVLAALLLIFSAPAIATFYGQPKLIVLARVMALNFVINSLGMVQAVQLSRKIDFKSQMKVSVSSIILAGVVGISMAFAGFGIWSLVWQSIVGNSIRTLALWRLTPWRPTLRFSFLRLRTMFHFGSRMLMTGVLYQIFENVYILVIGKLFTPADLGYYTRANTLQAIPLQNITGSLQRVALPVFAQLQGDKERFRHGVQRALEMAVYLNLPLMAVLALTARPLIVVLMTEKWLPCVPYFQVLCMAGLFYPYHLLNLSALAAKGESGLVLNIELFKKVMVVIAIAATYRFGILVMVIGQAVNSVLFIFANGWYSKKIFEFPIGRQLIAGLPYFLAVAVATATAWAAGLLVSGNWARLVVQGAVLGSSYLLLSWGLHLRAFEELKMHVMDFIGSRVCRKGGR